MECKCTCEDIPRIVRGNDFTLVAQVKKPALNAGSKMELVDFDLTNCTDICVNIVTRTGKKTSMPYTKDENKLYIPFNNRIQSGLYGLEVYGKDENHKNWRYYAQPGEVLQIVEETSRASVLETENVNGYYNLNVVVGIMQMTQDMIDEVKLATEEAKQAASEAKEVAERAQQVITDGLKDVVKAIDVDADTDE